MSEQEKEIINVSSNSEFKKCLSKYSFDNLSDFDVEIYLMKYCAYDELEYEGEYKGYKFHFWMGESIKTYDTDSNGTFYEARWKEFLDKIKDNELNELNLWDLGFSIESIDGTGNFFPIRNNWEGEVPKEIKEEAECDEFKALIDHCCENYDDIGVQTLFFEEDDQIAEINVGFDYDDKNIEINWSILN